MRERKKKETSKMKRTRRRRKRKRRRRDKQKHRVEEKVKSEYFAQCQGKKEKRSHGIKLQGRRYLTKDDTYDIEEPKIKGTKSR